MELTSFLRGWACWVSRTGLSFQEGFSLSPLGEAGELAGVGISSRPRFRNETTQR